jgi:hypothetical protein
MSQLNHYRPRINILAGQLGKLLKVINHSDPSADTVKHLLYDKYKQSLSDLVEEIKTDTSWSSFHFFLADLFKSDISNVEEEIKEIVTRKLMRDFESAFITRHKLSEFSAPEPGDQVQKERIRAIRKQIRNNRKQQEKIIPMMDLREMVQTKNQEKKGKSSLDKLVQVFNKIDPSNFEN